MPHANFIILSDNAPAYCDYDRSYDRSSVTVQATGDPISPTFERITGDTQSEVKQLALENRCLT